MTPRQATPRQFTAEEQMVQALAAQVAEDRLTKTYGIGPANSKGRQAWGRIAPPTPAEQMWMKLQEQNR